MDQRRQGEETSHEAEARLEWQEQVRDKPKLMVALLHNLVIPGAGAGRETGFIFYSFISYI